MVKTRSLTAIVYEEDDMYIAECPESLFRSLGQFAPLLDARE